VSTPVPQPGDFAVVSMGGQGGALISAMEQIAYDHSTHWDHSFIYVGTVDGKPDQIVQAEPGGAQIADLGTYQYAIWSTGILFPTATQRAAIVLAAEGYAAAKTGYSWADYAAIALHRFRIPAPGLKAFIADTHRMICSQLTDQCYADAGVHLFQDGRWPGFVAPFDLGQLLSLKNGDVHSP
jgi:hypothetical protein